MRDMPVLVLFFILLTSALQGEESKLSYSYIPKKVYENQLFPLTLVYHASYDAKPPPILRFDPASNTHPLTNKPLVVKNGDDIFYTFYFKAESDAKKKRMIHIPQLFISPNHDQSTIPSLNIPLLTLSSLHPPKDFSGVLATSMRIRNYQVSNYDAKHHLVSISLEAYEANLEDMKAPQAIESGIEEIRRDNAKVTGDFYLILPRSEKTYKLSYYDTIKQRFIPMRLNVKVADASVTTQSDLNPKVDAFKRLKRYILIALVIFFAIMYIWKKESLYIIIAVISLGALITFYIPHKNICIKQGAPLYILPTPTSTISAYVPERFTTKQLGKRGTFYKIELKQGVIGWIKDEEICNE